MTEQIKVKVEQSPIVFAQVVHEMDNKISC